LNDPSEEHEWFKKSVAKEDPYTDFYVWADPKGFDENGNPLAPSNWVRKTTIFFRAHKLQKKIPIKKNLNFLEFFNELDCFKEQQKRIKKTRLVLIG
jgi:glycosidase